MFERLKPEYMKNPPKLLQGWRLQVLSFGIGAYLVYSAFQEMPYTTPVMTFTGYSCLIVGSILLGAVALQCFVRVVRWLINSEWDHSGEKSEKENSHE